MCRLKVLWLYYDIKNSGNSAHFLTHKEQHHILINIFIYRISHYTKTQYIKNLFRCVFSLNKYFSMVQLNENVPRLNIGIPCIPNSYTFVHKKQFIHVVKIVNTFHTDHTMFPTKNCHLRLSLKLTKCQSCAYLPV